MYVPLSMSTKHTSYSLLKKETLRFREVGHDVSCLRIMTDRMGVRQETRTVTFSCFFYAVLSGCQKGLTSGKSKSVLPNDRLS